MKQSDFVGKSTTSLALWVCDEMANRPMLGLVLVPSFARYTAWRAGSKEKSMPLVALTIPAAGSGICVADELPAAM